MTTWLISSDFLLPMQGTDSMTLVVRTRTKPGPEAASHSRARRIAQGDLLFIWNVREDRLETFTMSEREFDADRDAVARLPFRREPLKVMTRPEPLLSPMSKQELHGLYYANRSGWKGHELFRDYGGLRLQFSRSTFCYDELPGALIEALHARLPQGVLASLAGRDEGQPPHVGRTFTLRPRPAQQLPRPSRGLAPMPWEGTVRRDADGEGATYLLRFGSRDVWKIGYTGDLDRRLGEINDHIPFFLEERWEPYTSLVWPTLQQAYAAEDAFKACLEHRSVGREQFECHEGEARQAWIEAVQEPWQRHGQRRA
jgi:hypothetical protein